MLRTVLAALIATAILTTSSLSARAAENTPAKTVAMFYDWYLQHHGRVERIWSQARELFDDDLFNDIDQTYFKGGSIGLHCPNSSNFQCVVRYDPFANATVAATSYAIGETHRNGQQTVVDVTVRSSDKMRSERHIKAIVKNNGRWYVIANLLYAESPYSYGRPIADLKKFLADYNC